MALCITESEILEALRSALPRADAEGFTSSEARRILGWSDRRTSRALQSLHAAGRLEFAGRRTEARIDGYPVHRPVYRLVR